MNTKTNEDSLGLNLNNLSKIKDPDFKKLLESATSLTPAPVSEEKMKEINEYIASCIKNCKRRHQKPSCFGLKSEIDLKFECELCITKKDCDEMVL